MKRFVVAWVATAIAATGAAVAALGLVSGALTGTSGQVMSQDEARAALATRTHSASPSATPAVPRTPATPQTATATPGPPEGELIRTPGGTVIASCSGGLVTLRSWSPAQGYSVDGVEPGPGREAELEFEAGEGEDVELKLGCSGDHPIRLPTS
jgi:hypothetical protein